MSRLLLGGALSGPKFAPTSLTSATLKAWYDASQETGADGTALSSISDHSGNGKTLSQATSTLQPTIQTGSDGRRYYLFDGVDDFVKAATASDWIFLHNACSVFVVAECVAHSADGRDTILDTGGQSSANIGIWFAFDDRGTTGAAGPDGLNLSVGKGTLGTFAYQILGSGADIAPAGIRHILAIISPQSGSVVERINGNRGEKNTAAIAGFSASSPLGALCMGARTSGAALPGHIKIHEVILCSGAISTAEREQVLAYLGRKWAGVTWSDENANSAIEVTSTYDSFPSAAPVTPGDLIVVARRGTDHLSAFADIVQWTLSTTDDWATWSASASSVIFDGTTENAELRDPGLVRLRDGRLLLTLHVEAVGGTGTSPPDACRWATSTDEGTTWSSLNTLNDGFAGYSRCSTRVLEMPNGDLLWAIYGGDGSDSSGVWWIKIYKSTDGATTWSHLADIGSSANDWEEPTLFRSPTTGDLICLIRSSSTTALYRAVSTDDGVTWSIPAKVQDRTNSAPQACQTSRGALVIAQRENTVGSGFIYTSLDDGATWTRGQKIFSTNGTTNFVYGAPVMFSRNVLVPFAGEVSSSVAHVLFTTWAEI